MQSDHISSIRLAAAACVLSLASAGAAQAVEIHSDVDVFGVGCSGSSALDPDGNPVACSGTITWDHEIDFGGKHLKEAFLTITAEGVDSEAPGGGVGPEMDEVFINDTSLGFLTDQDFYVEIFNLNPGPGALAGPIDGVSPVTALTMTTFDVTDLLVEGTNTIRVVVDPTNWVMEVETSSLRVTVPEPATLSILALGLVGLGFAGRRRIS